MVAYDPSYWMHQLQVITPTDVERHFQEIIESRPRAQGTILDADARLGREAARSSYCAEEPAGVGTQGHAQTWCGPHSVTLMRGVGAGLWVGVVLVASPSRPRTRTIPVSSGCCSSCPEESAGGWGSGRAGSRRSPVAPSRDTDR